MYYHFTLTAVLTVILIIYLFKKCRNNSNNNQQNTDESRSLLNDRSNLVRQSQHNEEINKEKRSFNKDKLIEEEKQPEYSEGLNEKKNSTKDGFIRKSGIPNLGNTCYLNSVIQELASIQKFVDVVSKSNSKVFKNLSKIFDLIWSNGSPSRFKPFIENFLSELRQNYPMFMTGAQNDCKELYNVLIDSFFEECSYVENFFSIKINQLFICKEQHRVEKEEPQLFLIIPASDKLDSKKCIKDIKEKEATLELYCESCGRLNDTKIITENLILPEYLVFYVADTTHQGRILQPELKIEENEYKLFGVICYYGSGKSGHYIAFTLNEGRWVKYNDAFVDEEDPDYSYAYMLFYKKN